MCAFIGVIFKGLAYRRNQPNARQLKPPIPAERHSPGFHGKSVLRHRAQAPGYTDNSFPSAVVVRKGEAVLHRAPGEDGGAGGGLHPDGLA